PWRDAHQCWRPFRLPSPIFFMCLEWASGFLAFAWVFVFDFAFALMGLPFLSSFGSPRCSRKRLRRPRAPPSIVRFTRMATSLLKKRHENVGDRVVVE